ncbi:MAG: transcription elongation factor GreA [Firmicutes bacterium]|jgi:transcription elongation factor GreA|nr:transcription elongation factor GreA [Bacillota bacterium]
MKKEEKIFLTPEGFLALEEELSDLKENQRPKVIQDIKEARALGDLSENAEYDTAKNEQARIEARIKEIEYKLEHSVVQEGSKDSVSIGSTVTIKYVDDDEEEVYKMVGSLEADPFDNKISNESPIGNAIFGKKVGDQIDVESPNGSYKIEIVKIA